MKDQIIYGALLFCLGLGIGSGVTMQIRDIRAKKAEQSVKDGYICISLEDHYTCAVNGKEFRYDKNGNYIAPKTVFVPNTGPLEVK